MRNDDIRLESSQRLIELLSNIEHSIAYALLDKIRYKEYFRVSYLDFGNKNDNVSYIINNKFFELADANPENWREKVWSEKRTNLKIGKFVKMLFDEYFPASQLRDQPVPKPRVDIESFVNMFKAEREKNVNYERFEMVKGEDIRRWYKIDNYSRFANSETPLGKSCMRYAESNKFLKMYSANTDIFSMLILKDDAGKLKGRALVWNLEIPNGRIFMDRVYTVNDFEIEVFKQYARDNGWLYRVEQKFGWFNKIADPTNGMIYESKDLLLQVTLSKCPEIHYDYYPYLDTLSIYNSETHILSNNGELRRKRNHLLLTDYQGRYHCEVDERPRVYSTVYNEEILEEDAVYVDIDDTWVYNGDEVTVHNTGGMTAYKRSPKIVQSRILDNVKYFMKSECVYSEYLDTYIFKSSVVNAFLDNKEKTPVIIHKNLIGILFEEKDGVVVYSKELEKKKHENEMKKYKKTRKPGLSDMYSNDIFFNLATSTVNPTPEPIRVRMDRYENARPVEPERLRNVSDEQPVERPIEEQPIGNTQNNVNDAMYTWTNVYYTNGHVNTSSEPVNNTLSDDIQEPTTWYDVVGSIEYSTETDNVQEPTTGNISEDVYDLDSYGGNVYIHRGNNGNSYMYDSNNETVRMLYEEYMRQIEERMRNRGRR